MSYLSASANESAKLPETKVIMSAIAVKKYTKEVTEIYNVNSELICKTELVPYFLIGSKNAQKKLNKASDDFFSQVNSKKNLDCQEKILLKVAAKEGLLCLTNPSAKNLMQILAQVCGR